MSPLIVASENNPICQSDVTLHQLQDIYWQNQLSTSPEIATLTGCAGNHCAWTNFSPAALQKNQQTTDDHLKIIHTIDRSALSRRHKLQYDILKWLLTTQKESYAFPYEALSLNQMQGIYLTIPIILQIVPGNLPQDYDAILTRMRGVPELIDQHIELIYSSMNKGIVLPKIAIRSVPAQIAEQIAMPPEQSPFFGAFQNISDEAMRKKAAGAILESIYPAYKKLYHFVINEYLPACRDTVGLSEIPGGKAAYAHLVKEHTTTNLRPEEIHLIGLKEVARIKIEMEKTLQAAQFTGDIHQYNALLRQDAAHFYSSAEDLLQGYQDLLIQIETQLPKLFNCLPTLPCKVVAMPEYEAISSDSAYYLQGSINSGRPGLFFVNTAHFSSHPKWSMDALALHEALPGHHFQTTIAQMADLPALQKNNWTTAFVEGWGLYSESLGKELGLYQTPAAYFNRLCFEMLRAVRLVVDTGIHSKKWTRLQAIDYCKALLPIEEHEIINEVDRYIVMPAQALAYKIGELNIHALRQQVERSQGSDFNIQVFHDKLLQLGGCLPFEALDSYFQK